MINEKYIAVRKETEKICTLLQDEDYVVQVAEFASPAKWHLAHTTWFFERFVLKDHVKGYKEFNAEFDYLFNSYYESIGKRISRDKRGVIFRPFTSEVYEYRKFVDEHILKNFSSFSSEVQNVIELGINHEQQHQELLITDTKYLFSQHPLFPVWDENATLDKYKDANSLHWLLVDEGVYNIGHETQDFCFDNELPLHKQYIHSFEIMDRAVTNAEYIEFINGGGYKDFRFWLAEGWDWINKNEINKPMYWHLNDNGDYSFYHLDGLKKIDPDLPLMHVSYYEAEAFAHWKGMSLPTEFEWETAAKKYPGSFKNIVWEWTQSAYLPYPGFKIAPGAIGEYNGKFMVNQMVLRGGSLATPTGHSRNTYRNFFHPQMQWQFSGIRLIKRT